MRLSLLAATACVAGLACTAPLALAAKPKHPAGKPDAPAAAPAAPVTGANPKDTTVAIVGGHAIRLSDLDAAVNELPPQMRNMSAQQLYPLLVDQLVDREALVLKARKDKLQDDPAVQVQIARANDQVLQNAILRRDIAPQLTDAAMHAAYDKNIGTKPGEEEVQASHILVATQDQANKIIAELKGGADFATLAKKYSTDPTGAQNGGDLGYFKRGDMLPEFSTAAFALQPGQYTPTPVKTRYGFHVIKVFNHRLSPPPTFAEAQPQLQQQMVQKLVQAEVDQAKQGLVIQRFNSDGSPATGTPVASPPPGAPAPGSVPGVVPAAPPAPVVAPPGK